MAKIGYTDCGGRGGWAGRSDNVNLDSPVTCPTCGGSGLIQCDHFGSKKDQPGPEKATGEAPG